MQEMVNSPRLEQAGQQAERSNLDCWRMGNIFAQTAPSEIIENSLQAIGGKKEIVKVLNLNAFADCIGPNGTDLCL